MLRNFIAIDFETANQEPSSVCSVGVVMVRDGQIVDSFYSLIQPEPIRRIRIFPWQSLTDPHDCISKGIYLCICQKCCTFAPYY